MRFFRKESVDSADIFPIDNLPIETFGEHNHDALALLYKPSSFQEGKEGTSSSHKIQIDHRKEEFFRRILPILDGFDNIFKFVERTHPERDETLNNWLKTLESLYRRLLSALEKEGLVAIESVGKPLDLTYHEVIDTREEPEVPNNTIIEEMVKGYKFGRRVLRDAKVIVAKNPSAPSLKKS